MGPTKTSLLLALFSFPALAQAPANAPAASSAPSEVSIRSRMEISLAKQRESVRRQVSNAVEVPPAAAASWFTVPWDKPEASIANNVPQPQCPELPPSQLDTLIEKTAIDTKLPTILLKEVIRRESAFQPCAVSAKGAMGLMQLMPETAAGFGVTDAFEPESNLSAGARFLASLLDRYKGDRRLALAAYNAGVERVAQYRGVPPFPETENYVREILDRVEAAKAKETASTVSGTPPVGGQ